jgi:hypothetical protein
MSSPKVMRAGRKQGNSYFTSGSVYRSPATSVTFSGCRVWKMPADVEPRALIGLLVLGLLSCEDAFPCSGKIPWDAQHRLTSRVLRACCARGVKQKGAACQSKGVPPPPVLSFQTASVEDACDIESFSRVSERPSGPWRSLAVVAHLSKLWQV